MMTYDQARSDFSRLMQVARKRTLSPAEKERLMQARQALRMAKRSVMRNKAKVLSRKKAAEMLSLHEYVSPRQRRFLAARASGAPVRKNAPKRRRTTARRNPQGTEIYAHVLDITAQRVGPHRCGAACRKVHHVYRHVFKSKPPIFGLPDGSLLIKD